MDEDADVDESTGSLDTASDYVKQVNYSPNYYTIFSGNVLASELFCMTNSVQLTYVFKMYTMS